MHARTRARPCVPDTMTTTTRNDRRRREQPRSATFPNSLDRNRNHQRSHAPNHPRHATPRSGRNGGGFPPRERLLESQRKGSPAAHHQTTRVLSHQSHQRQRQRQHGERAPDAFSRPTHHHISPATVLPICRKPHDHASRHLPHRPARASSAPGRCVTARSTAMSHRGAGPYIAASAIAARPRCLSRAAGAGVRRAAPRAVAVDGGERGTARVFVILRARARGM